MDYTGTLRIPPDNVEVANRLLRGQEISDVREGDIVQKWTHNFGGGYEADIKLVAGDPAGYIDAVLFYHGSEVYPLEPDFEQLEGEYVWNVEENTFTLNVVSGEPRKAWDPRVSGARMGAIEGWAVTQDGETVAGPFGNDALAVQWLHNRQSQSVDWAVMNEGYDIVEVRDGEVTWSYRQHLQNPPAIEPHMEPDPDPDPDVGPLELGAIELVELGETEEDYLGAKAKKRISLSEAKKIAKKVGKELRPFADELILAGSIRRKRPEIGDVEFVMLPKGLDTPDFDRVILWVAAELKELGYDVGPSIRKATKTVDGVKIEIYLAHHERERGGLVFMYTGDQQFNIAMRNKAKGMGYLLNQYGIWTRDKKRALLQSPNEEDFFDFLKVPYHTPEERSLRHRTKKEREKFAKKKKKSGGRMGMLSDNEDAFFSRLESVWSNDDGNDAG